MSDAKTPPRYKNPTQEAIMNLLDDWQVHPLLELMAAAGQKTRHAFAIQLTKLRQKLRKKDLDIIFQEGAGYRMVSLLPPAERF